MGSSWSLNAKIKKKETGVRGKYVSTDGNEDETLQSTNLKNFSFSDLKRATRNFHPHRLVGEGDFGSVFKGWIDENSFSPTKPGTGIAIAVKTLKKRLYEDSEWLAGVNFLGQLDHPHLVKLIGYCLEGEQRLLVYEFMPGGSLKDHLFRSGSSSFPPLSWSLRLKVALGAAKGFAFLHSAKARLIYRDFPSNILLDSSYNAKLSDYGLPKDDPPRAGAMMIHRYEAPDYLITGSYSVRSDVFSFGVVLLQVLSGRSAVDENGPPGEYKLVLWAQPYLANKRRILHILDNRLEGQYSMDDAHKAAALASRCLSVDPRSRPTMDEVVTALEELQDPNASGSNDARSVNANEMRRRSADDVSSGGKNTAVACGGCLSKTLCFRT